MKTLELLKLDKQAFLEHLDSLDNAELDLEYRRMEMLNEALGIKETINYEQELSEKITDVVGMLLGAAPEHSEAIIDSVKAVGESLGILIEFDDE